MKCNSAQHKQRGVCRKREQCNYVQQADAIKLSISDLSKVIPFVKMLECSRKSSNSWQSHAQKVQIVVGHLLFCLKSVAKRQSELFVHELLDLCEHSSILTNGMTLLRSEIDSLIASVCCT